MRRGIGLLVVGLLGLLGVFPAPGIAAPTTAAIATLRVDIWPEHDDPRILIIYRGTLSPETPLPYTLSFSIPTGAVVHAAAYNRDGQLFTAQYQTARSGETAQITFVVPVPDFQFEYYLDVITPPPQRTFEATVIFPLPVGTLQVSVEQPLRATDFTLTSAADSTAASGGFTYHLYAAQGWPAGKPWTVRGSYRKEDTVPSLTPAPPVALPTEGVRTIPLVLTAVVGVVAGVIGVLLVGYLRRPKASRRTGGGSPARRSGRQDHRYCSNCGHRVGQTDLFCSNCGEVL